MGSGKDIRRIFLVDFGMSRRYCGQDNVIYQPRTRCQFRGTPVYAPRASHNRAEHNRKSDLESWGYMMIEMTTGKLPWSNLNVEKELDEIGEMKSNYWKDHISQKCCMIAQKNIRKY